MLNHSVLRPAIGLPFAGLIVFGLFSFMERMVSVEFAPPEVSPQRMLEAFVAPEPEDQDVHEVSLEPEKLELADRPPPPPKQAAGTPDIDLPVPQFDGAVPGRLDIVRLDQMPLSPVAINEREAQPIRPPVPVYPRRAAERSLEGRCDVQFDVDVRGRPHNIQAACSDRIFVREAEAAVSRVQFVPKIQRGRPVERQNVVYPLEFRLKGG